MCAHNPTGMDPTMEQWDRIKDVMRVRRKDKIIFFGISNNQQVDSLMQERRNSIANALELCLSCTNPSK